ncbi:XTP/dITP diphosphatase [Brevibacillus agri]|uniref:XTP/dITP diphosphatase n=1 Tax=Brevibacillus TaxID=55080 RepID=UPI0002716E16|nr:MULTISPECIES: XTP/dITP diphosphatase [Brevibacillus]ELK44093.1 nucleoside-triphosphatase [Brevibacillus agri BAB-2500]EJL43883.1 non-canonical purine NTP pyrophosphatase, RdgB/HAM1 family [Brevibacillus sp. CF112]MBG9566197.1 purine NTP phosphatase [Brevibacillus agri]MBY0050219.1 XTP/dITP diphosphatase [Brevibacillus agri]MCG5250553.1 XTP/dITP diphosphatase [Brevibacillus agri]
MSDRKKVVLATRNQGKVKEFNRLFADYGWEGISLAQYEGVPEVVEDGDTFEANALKKAIEISTYLQLPALGDDSGLEVDALDGRPGVYSARYAGEEATDEQNWRKLLHELEDVPMEQRTARFRCTLALVVPGEEPIIATGACEGLIAREPKGTNGFGYDPVFYIPELEKRMAELLPEEKNQISHRAKAMQKLLEVLK